ncbi:helix-turn-helix transcriptional regulator [Ligilactobacillus cholophilus]|uniref:helix-turn-helix transcriptional regulator n=1 Tax=Ligilactobacillus cholophilus TaxID=3050131 RepID=UPI0025B0737B|nr:helix-turn-helix transcriptional regulator [Ligilactobacillus cholophilus]
MILNRLQEIRERNDLTEKEVAKKIYVSPQSYSGYEKQYRTPSLETCFLLAKLFNCKIEDLFWEM